jgi:hypothetical protein
MIYATTSTDWLVNKKQIYFLNYRINSQELGLVMQHATGVALTLGHATGCLAKP